MVKRLAVAWLVAWGLVVTGVPGPLESIKDEAIHWFNVARAGALGLPLGELLVIDPAYPPAWYLLARLGPLAVLRGESPLPSRLLLTVPNAALVGLLMVTLASVQGVSRHRSALTALGLGVALFSWSIAATPEVVVVAATVAFAGAAVRYAHRPSDAGVMLLALATAAALLAKQTTPVFCLVPLAYVVAQRREPRWLLGAALAVVLGALGAWLLFYGRLHHDPLRDVLVRATTGESTLHPESAGGRLFYLGSLARFAGPAVLVPLFARGALRAGRATPPLAQERWLLAAVVVPVVLLSLFPVKQDSYLLPVVPPLILWCCLPLDRLQRAPRGVATGLLVFAFCGSALFGALPDSLQMARQAPVEDALFRGAALGLVEACPGCQTPVLTNHRGLASRLLHLRLIEDGAHFTGEPVAVAPTGVRPPSRIGADAFAVVLRSAGADLSVCLSSQELERWQSRPDLGPPPSVHEEAVAQAALGGAVVASWGAELTPGWRVPLPVTLCRL